MSEETRGEERFDARLYERVRAGRAVLAARLHEAYRQMTEADREWAAAFEADVIQGGYPERANPVTEAGERRLERDREQYLKLVGATGWCEFDDAPAWDDDGAEGNEGVRRCPACKTCDDLGRADEAAA